MYSVLLFYAAYLVTVSQWVSSAFFC